MCFSLGDASRALVEAGEPREIVYIGSGRYLSMNVRLYIFKCWTVDLSIR